MIHLEVESCSACCSIQDRGRMAFRHAGIPRSGTLDLLALAAANALVGNPIWACAIELFAGGICLHAAGGTVRLALSGAEHAIRIDGVPVACNASFLLHPGQQLDIAGPRSGVCAVLAVEGGIDAAEVMGARALHARSKLGGLTGRFLLPGDRLPLVCAASIREEHSLAPIDLCTLRPVRVVLGPQLDLFSPQALDVFLERAFSVLQGDRMGYRLSGPRLESDNATGLISEGVIEGCIQVTAAGEPIVLLADHQTVGGYPKIACVITADVRVVVQRPAGSEIRFAAVSVAQAQAEFNQWTSRLARLASEIRPRSSAIDVGAVADNAVNATDTSSWLWRGPH